MSIDLNPDQLEALHAYAAGRLGTRATIDRAGMHDYADLVIALAQNDLDLPKPPATPAHEARVARARGILQPRLRHGD
jgi:hypothetical protein